LKNDTELKVKISELKRKFLSSTEALIHGDLHTGSVMVCEDSIQSFVDFSHVTSSFANSCFVWASFNVCLMLVHTLFETKFVITSTLMYYSHSIMRTQAKEGSTFVFDAEFAFYGPMGFDIGAFVANLVLSICSQPGHATAGVLPKIVVFIKFFGHY
jgi:5-methylthioribose kinase